MSGHVKRLLALRFRISTQLYLGIGGAVVLTVAASLVGWFSFDRVGNAQARVNEGSLPELELAFGVAEYSSQLVAAAPNLAAAATPDELADVSSRIAEDQRVFEQQLADLERRATDPERFTQIRGHADALIFNIEALTVDRSALFSLSERSELGLEQFAGLRSRLDSLVIPAIDDQLFYAMTGYREIGAPARPRAEHLSETEIARYRHLAELQGDLNIVTQLMATASSVSIAAAIEPLRERFEAAVGRMQRNLRSLGEPLRGVLEPVFTEMFNAGLDEGRGFDLFEQQLRLRERQQELLALNRVIVIDLVNEVDGLVNAANASALDATQASSQAIGTGRTLLLAISGVSVGGALLIAWLYVGRVLLRRLESLSDRMRRMAEGDIEEPVEIIGQDEVADMAAALEVFRRHAHEVQRLNLVEKLAEELQGKNDQLEVVLADLQKAQDQIVVREKLAALGELTAGVAHEIRNPLNFVKNFSESSEELLVEMREVMEEGDGQLTDDQRELIGEIQQDLSDNLTRILSHGDRANRIVQDMLQMGRESTDVQATDINKLVDEHARLAYHSARATDPNFQLDMKQEFDPDAGEIEAVPQELGRVFLNMVSNACDATDEKRRAAQEAGTAADYMPTLELFTRRAEEHVEVRVRDNGSGMPPEVMEKIFNPFFTTKPTNRGTGLGLAITRDIVQKHGGTIQVESEAGEFTEMIVQLPLQSARAEAESGEPASAGG